MRITSNAAHLTRSDTRAARYASGLACIRCGCTIWLYCQIEDTAEADVFLLCPACRDKLNAMEDMEAVLRVLRRHPVAAQAQFARASLPYMRGYDVPDTAFPGGAVMRRSAFPIVFGGKPLLSLVPPETYAGPVQLTLSLGRLGRAPELVVNANEWLGEPGCWSFAWRGNRYCIESADGTAMLVLVFGEGDRIEIERLRSANGPHVMEIDADGARFDGAALVIPSSDSKVIGLRV